MLVNLAIFSVLIVLSIVTINNNKTFAEPILKDSSLRYAPDIDVIKPSKLSSLLLDRWRQIDVVSDKR